MKFFGYTERRPISIEIANEINLMKTLNGVQGVVQMYGVFDDTPKGLISSKNPSFLRPYPVIVMEMIEGGELYQRLSRLFFSISFNMTT